MGASPERRKWLADRLRQVAADEEAAGASAIAAEFLRQAQLLEDGLVT